MSWTTEKQACADLAVRMDAATLVADIVDGSRQVPEGLDPLAQFAIETMVRLAQHWPGVYRQLLDDVPTKTMRGALNRLTGQAYLHLFRTSLDRQRQEEL